MKLLSKFLIVTVLIAVLSACGENATPTQEEDTISLAYTSAAMTLGAQMQTSTPFATATSLPTTLPTLYIVPTFVDASSPTAQSVTSSYTYYSTANGCNDSIYISDVTIPDGTVLAPSESFTKTWEFQNTGTCDWDEDYLITFTSGTDMDGETTEIDQEVLTGSVGDISVSLIAPETEGTYIGYWSLTDSDGNAFGQAVYVMIVVSDDASTLTPTVTATEETAATSTPTSTLAATSAPTSTPAATATSAPTLTPTDTYTPTPVPTDTPIPTETEED